jgi:hypothetical protein
MSFSPRLAVAILGLVVTGCGFGDNAPEARQLPIDAPGVMAVCGNKVVEPGEECDGQPRCTSGCTIEDMVAGPEQLCNDGQDNDQDAAADCADSDCAAAPSCDEGPEVACTDGLDNDNDSATDCDDSDCASVPACKPIVTKHYSANPMIAIPDAPATGIISSIAVPDSGMIVEVTLSVNITHTYVGDLTVVLSKGEASETAWNRAGGSNDNIVMSFPVSAIRGESAGTWTLGVTDHSGADVGTLNSWALAITYQ